MGTLSGVSGSLLYLDANIIIYAAEGPVVVGSPLQRLLLQVDSGALSTVTSELTLAEVLVRPLRNGDTVLADKFRQRVTSGPTMSTVAVSRGVLERAAELRAAHPALKLPDAIHAATSLLAGCTTFLTNDVRFESVTGLPVLLLSKLP